MTWHFFWGFFCINYVIYIIRYQGTDFAAELEAVNAYNSIQNNSVQDKSETESNVKGKRIHALNAFKTQILEMVENLSPLT